MLPVSYRTQMCINSGLLKPDAIGSLRVISWIYRLKHQIRLLASSLDTLSASLPIDSAMNINSDLADSQQNCQYFKPNSSISK